MNFRCSKRLETTLKIDQLYARLLIQPFRCWRHWNGKLGSKFLKWLSTLVLALKALTYQKHTMTNLWQEEYLYRPHLRHLWMASYTEVKLTDCMTPLATPLNGQLHRSEAHRLHMYQCCGWMRTFAGSVYTKLQPKEVRAL